MKLSNSRLFAIIGEANKIGLALEDNTSVIVCLHRYNGMKVQHLVEKDSASTVIAHAGDQFLEKAIFCYFDKQTIPSASSVFTYDRIQSGCCLKILSVNGSKLFTFHKGNYAEPASNCHQPHVCFKGTVNDCQNC
jgi:hypothetical protein